MTGHTPQELLAALGKAQRAAWTTKKTQHVVVNDGLIAWVTGPLRVVDQVEPRHTVVIRDVHPKGMTGEMCEAYCEAVLHDPNRTRHIADALRRITYMPSGERFSTEERALLLWDMAEDIARADHRRDVEPVLSASANR